MCGICGIINFNNAFSEQEKIQKMMKVMKHRGPNDNGIYIDGNFGFGFVRLSILDLSSLGHQPMFDSTGRYMIIHNGEVFNFIEIREKLLQKGYIFKSKTDTEVILYSYIEWGQECLNIFNGMWAFVIYDKLKKTLFCARDRFGIKPFYYYCDEEKFIFSSEIPPILSILKTKPTPNYEAIYDYLVFNRTDQTEKTFFNEIKKLQHGHILTIENNKIMIKRWYDLRNRIKNIEGFRNSEEYRELFSSAVGLRLRSDVPVGVCLSGGLDSSSIVSILIKDYNKKDLQTFSAIYGNGKYGDESEFIHQFNGLLTNMFYTYPSSETLKNDLMKFIRAHGEPIPSTSPYAQFKVMELAKEHVVVTLDGQGADESLAGYHYFFGFLFKDLLQKLKFLDFGKEILFYLLNHKSIYGIKSFIYFLLPPSQKMNLRLKEKDYLNLDFAESNKNSVISDNLYGSDSLQDALLNHFEYKLEHLLKWEDRNSMYFSLEARVPFLDYRLVEKTIASSSEFIINKGMTKAILRDAMKNTLPEKIRLRKDKIGFGTPQDEWFREESFVEFINDLLSSDSLKKRCIIDTEKAKQLYQKHINKETNISKEIWKWINLELWYREFVD